MLTRDDRRQIVVVLRVRVGAEGEERRQRGQSCSERDKRAQARRCESRKIRFTRRGHAGPNPTAVPERCELRCSAQASREITADTHSAAATETASSER